MNIKLKLYCIYIIKKNVFKLCTSLRTIRDYVVLFFFFFFKRKKLFMNKDNALKKKKKK